MIKERIPMQTAFTSMAPDHDIILTIGAFDGVHLGHRHLAQQVVRRARQRGCLGGAITFEPHPRTVLAGQGPPCLASLDERLGLLHETGLDVVTALPFTRELAELPALEFMQMVRRQFQLRELWVGWDFALGRRREGTATRLAEIGSELGYRLHVVPPFYRNGQIVSSSLIRSLIRQGEVEQAARLLGRCHRVHGTLPGGDLRGRQPAPATIAVAEAANPALPAEGTYAVHARLGTRAWPAEVCVQPASAGGERLLDLWSPLPVRGLHGQSIQIEFVRRLPPTVRSFLAGGFSTQLQKSQAPVQAPSPL